MPKGRLTETRIAALKLGEDGTQKCLWDSKVERFGVRAIGKKKYYIVQARLNGKTLQYKMGDLGLYETIDEARQEARELLIKIDKGIDPREEKRQRAAEQEADKVERERVDSLESTKARPLAELWEEYLQDRRPRWSERHYRDHKDISRPGGAPVKRGKGVLQAGELYPLLAPPVGDLTAVTVEKWLHKQVEARPTRAALALRLFRAFLNWCGEHEVYGGMIPAGIITKRITTAVPKPAAKDDYLQREQLPGWFSAVRQVHNPIISAYLQCLLLTGARREELASLEWDNVDLRWKSITIHDKVKEWRTIPLTPYVESLLQRLPRRNKWVFSSATSSVGYIREPRIAHNKALVVAGIGGLTLHGLRRSFGSLSEWCELPVGVVAQIQGHAPNAIAEKHYRVRPLDLLRTWHEKFESWMLEQAGVDVPKQSAELVVLKRRATG